MIFVHVLPAEFLQWDVVRGLDYYISMRCCWHPDDTDEDYESNCTERALAIMSRLASVLHSRCILVSNLQRVVEVRERDADSPPTDAST